MSYVIDNNGTDLSNNFICHVNFTHVFFTLSLLYTINDLAFFSSKKVRIFLNAFLGMFCFTQLLFWDMLERYPYSTNKLNHKGHFGGTFLARENFRNSLERREEPMENNKFSWQRKRNVVKVIKKSYFSVRRSKPYRV